MTASTPPTLSLDLIADICAGRHGDPFSVLGPHMVMLDGQSAVAVRAFLPFDRAVSVVSVQEPAETTPMRQLHPAGFYEAVFAGRDPTFRYRLRVAGADGDERLIEDPYAFPPLLSDYDLHLLGEGTHHRSYEKLGAHLREVNGVRGAHFAVWAPHAGRVSVIGPFNRWDGRVHPMRFRHEAGLWEIFLPGLEAGTPYKYEICSQGQRGKADKADPYGFAAELRPQTASLIYDVDAYQWGDAGWMGRRRARDLNQPMSIYEVHLGSWRRVPDEANRWLTYRELAHQLIAYVKEMGYTHIELLPITEHPYDGSWGYQTVGYFAPTSRYGSPADFMYFVDTCHQNGIGVFLDWAPAHFPKDVHGLNTFDGTHLYEHADPRRGEHQDWGTLIFNYGRNEVRNFLLSSAMFWLNKYHLDGLRVDAVASMLYLDYSRKPGEWLPNRFGGRENLEAVDFLKEFNRLVHEAYPGVLTIAEESTAWPMVTRPVYLGGLGFDLKWNMGWMHDLLAYMACDPLFRRNEQGKLTFSLMYAFSENYLLPLSHDEVVHLKKSLLDKMPGDRWQKFANLRAFYGFMTAHPGKKLLFMGGEFGQWAEWSEARSLDWHLLEGEPHGAAHRGLQKFVADLNRLYRAEPSLYEVDGSWDGFEWIDFRDIDHSIVAFMRRAKDPQDFLVVACNFTPVPRSGYRLGVPALGEYRERLNSDAAPYGGSGMGNPQPVPAEAVKWHTQPYSVVVTLPPLSTIILKPLNPQFPPPKAEAAEEDPAEPMAQKKDDTAEGDALTADNG